VKLRNLVAACAPMFFGTGCGGCIDNTVHDDAIKHHDVGIEYLSQGQCVQAEERCRLALEYGPNFEHPHNCLGMVALNCHGDLDAAAQHFKDAIAINADFAQAHNNLGTTFIRENPPDYDAACDEFSSALEIDPAYLDARENYGYCLMRRGTILGQTGNPEGQRRHYAEARSHLIRLLEMNPNNFNARHHLGFMDLLEQRYDSAEQNFSRCLEIDPGNPVCSYNMGHVYLETARCSDAIQAFITALQEDERSEVAIGARHNLGVAYELCAKKDGAIREHLTQIRKDPGNPESHFTLGNIYADKGLEDRAVNEWENTVKLDPLYCPAYFKLAMYHNRTLDTRRTIARCQDFVACAAEVNRSAPTPRFGTEVPRCKALVKQLQME
jgi:tetratricopeptide (TPR) repeat protein